MTPTAKFTTGPLELGRERGAWGDYVCVIDATGRSLATCWGSPEEKFANAWLWSAAPELYAAVAAQHRLIDSLLARLIVLDPGFKPSAAFRHTVELSRAALRKARGSP